VIVEDGPIGAELTDVIDEVRDVLAVKSVQLDSNVGLGGALHEGLQHCIHPLVARTDADDVSLPSRLELQLQRFKSDPGLDILGTFATEIDENSTPGVLRIMPTSHEEIVDKLWACPLLHPTVMFRRDRVLAAGNYDPLLRRRQDYELWFRCAHYGLRFANVEMPLILYRFNRRTHGRQSVRLAFEQARIGYRGVALQNMAYWKRLACFVPLARSLLPTWLQHRFYYALRRFDPRQNIRRD
jgi:glycosyltransferase involved in cell wall biosynthesis